MESGNRVETGRLAVEIESLLFASDTPLSIGRLSSITGESSLKTIKEALGELEKFYRSCGRSFGIVEVAGGYQIATLPEYAAMVSRLFTSRRKAKLSQAALETLAIVAYRQPISRTGVEAIRGVNCDGVLATLTERELIVISGRGEGLGRPFLYSTTARFLEYLGLKDIRDIPDMEELEKSLETINLIPAPEHPEGAVEDTVEVEESGDIDTGEDDGELMSPKIRINRFLASTGIGSRRNCEDLIREGRVQVNGETVSELASFIDTESDRVEVDGKAVDTVTGRMILVINKPLGVLSTVSDDRGRKTVIGLALEKGYGERIFPVGRLDKDTTGLLLLTNDGDLAYRLTHPRYKIEKRYLVKVEGLIESRTVESIGSGIDLGDYVTLPCAVKVIERSDVSSTLEIRLKEGKKRQIRRMFTESGHPVLELRRIALGDLEFSDLENGDIRPLTDEEEFRLKEMTGLL